MPRVARQTISAKGREFLILQEGIRRYAYNDSAGHATFGVGHLLHRGRVTEIDRRNWGTPGRPSSRARVLSVLADDLVKYEVAVWEAVGKRRLKQARFDACVSLAFNIGEAGFRDSTVARVLRGRWSPLRTRRAADAFLLWRNPPELVPRRRRERRLFLTGKYT